MHRRGDHGIWERFVPGVGPRRAVQVRDHSRETARRVDKADPYAFAAEVRPRTASKVWDLAGYEWGDRDWMAARREANSTRRADLDLRGPSRLVDARARRRATAG